MGNMLKILLKLISIWPLPNIGYPGTEMFPLKVMRLRLSYCLFLDGVKTRSSSNKWSHSPISRLASVWRVEAPTTVQKYSTTLSPHTTVQKSSTILSIQTALEKYSTRIVTTHNSTKEAPHYHHTQLYKVYHHIITTHNSTNCSATLSLSNQDHFLVWASPTFPLSCLDQECCLKWKLVSVCINKEGGGEGGIVFCFESHLYEIYI